MGIKTDAFTTEIVTSFFEQLTDNDVYFVGSDYNASNTSTNSNYSLKYILERAIFGIKVDEEDVSYMIKKTFWAPGIVYSMYDDQAVLNETNYFVIVAPESEDGDYEVFKCIFNNNGGVSQSKPVYNENIFESGGDSNVADGYIWRYMFTVDTATVRKFVTTNFFPVVEDPAIANNVVDGINTILVENYQTNFGYERVAAFANTVPDGVTGRINILVSDGFVFNEAVNNYVGEVAYITKSEDDEVIASKQYVIKGSGKSNQEFYIDIDGYVPAEFEVEKNDQIEILPRIVITGTGEGAEGIAIFDATNTRINSIKMISRGEGYTAAEAHIVEPNYFSITTGDVTGELRPIISPAGGHGSNVVRELRSDALCVSGVITSYSTAIPDTNEYSKIALVYSPSFVERDANNTPTGPETPPSSFDNRILITTSGVGAAEAGDAVSQSNGATGVIHEIDGNNVYVINFASGNSTKFVSSLPLSIGAASINITNVEYPTYLERSGTVLYITDFQPIERDEEKEEVIKILIDF
jgi:hypothetical protein